jgi:hypothetical protein
MVVLTWMIRGTWSEMKHVREESDVLGNIWVQARFMKTLSRHSRVGSARLLVHVYLWSRSGSSMRESELIFSLKASALC